MSAVFSELAKGDGVTAGLRKVTDDMKVTHTNTHSRVGALAHFVVFLILKI
jgi:hypothetical protein